MKKNYSIVAFFILPLIIGILIVLHFVAAPLFTQIQYKDFTITRYTLEGKKYNLLVADTPRKWEAGLMYYRKLPLVQGMIFLFPNRGLRTFWNKNTYINLTLYWLDGDSVVGKTPLPSIEKSGSIVFVSSPRPVDKVVELSTR